MMWPGLMFALAVFNLVWFVLFGAGANGAMGLMFVGFSILMYWEER